MRIGYKEVDTTCEFSTSRFNNDSRRKDTMTKILVLDAGHGLYTSGKQTMNGSKGIIKEWTLNNAVCNYIESFLKDYDVKIYRTDDKTGKTDVSLSSRVSKTNVYNPDLFVSIHHNAGGGTGTEVYYHTYGTVEDKKVATIVAPKLASSLACHNRGVKQASFTVLGCRPTAILIEGGFMDTKADYDVMVTSAGQTKYAQAVAQSIIEYLNLKKIKTSAPTVAPTTSATSSTFKTGDVVEITGSNYATGQTIPSWAKKTTYRIDKISENKALLSDIISWVYLDDLRKAGDSSFLVEVTCNVLNIRQTDSFSSKVVGTVKKGEVFTITEESNGLGQLKSGVGWISLNSSYIKRK